MRRVTLVALAVALCCAAGLVSAGLPTCGATCTTNGDCVLSQDGCSVCRDGKCSQQCGAQCNKDSDCGLIPGGKSAAVAAELGSGGQCFVCYFNQCGSQYCGSQCSSDSQCASNPLCKVCTQGACSPPPTPKPSVPPTPAPPTPPPTPAPGKAAWGAIYCAQGDCSTNSYFNFGATLTQAETIAEETTPTGDGQPTLFAYWTQPLPCAAFVLSASFDPFFVNSTDLGTASTQAVSNCRAANHSQCFLAIAACAIFPPTGSRWGGIATVGGPESLGAITLETNNGTGYDTWEEAMNVTMNDCQGGSNSFNSCGLTAVFYNCMAFANTPDQAASVNFANSLSAAKSAALQSCFFETQGAGGCSIASAACIAPFHESNDHTVTGGRTWRFNKTRRTWVEKNQAAGDKVSP